MQRFFQLIEHSSQPQCLAKELRIIVCCLLTMFSKFNLSQKCQKIKFKNYCSAYYCIVKQLRSSQTLTGSKLKPVQITIFYFFKTKNNGT